MKRSTEQTTDTASRTNLVTPSVPNSRYQPNEAMRAIQAKMLASALPSAFQPNDALRAIQAKMTSARRPLPLSSGSPRHTIQRKGWTWNGASWDPDSGSRMPQPTIRGGAVGARLVNMDPPTIDDIIADASNVGLSIGAYNNGLTYAASAFGFAGHAAHSSNHVHDNPRTRLREMADAGATSAHLLEVLRRWGR